MKMQENTPESMYTKEGLKYIYNKVGKERALEYFRRGELDSLYEDLRREDYLEDIRELGGTSLDTSVSANRLEVIRDDLLRKESVRRLGRSLGYSSILYKQVEELLDEKYRTTGDSVYNHLVDPIEKHSPPRLHPVESPFGIQDTSTKIFLEMDFDSMLGLYDTSPYFAGQLDSEHVLGALSTKWNLPKAKTFLELLKLHDDNYASIRCSRDPLICLYTAIRDGNIEVTEYFLDKIGNVSYSDPFIIAVMRGDIEMYKLLRSRLALKTEYYDHIFEMSIFSRNLDCVKYVHEDTQSLLYSAYEASLQIGNMEVILYLESLGYRWYNKFGDYAVLSGNLEVVKHAEQKGMNWDQYLIERAVIGGSIEVVEYISGKMAANWDGLLRFGIMSGNMDMVRYVKDKGALWDQLDSEKYIKDALESGNMELIGYVEENVTVDYTVNVLASVAISQRLDILKYVMHKNKDLDFYSLLYSMIQFGTLEMLEYVSPEGVEYTEDDLDLMFRGYDIFTKAYTKWVDYTWYFNYIVKYQTAYEKVYGPKN